MEHLQIILMLLFLARALAWADAILAFHSFIYLFDFWTQYTILSIPIALTFYKHIETEPFNQQDATKIWKMLARSTLIKTHSCYDICLQKVTVKTNVNFSLRQKNSLDCLFNTPFSLAKFNSALSEYFYSLRHLYLAILLSASLVDTSNYVYFCL